MGTLSALPVSREYPARSITLRGEPPLVLRPMLMTDADQVSVAIAASAKELKAFMPWAHYPQTPQSQLGRLRDGEAAYYSGRDMVMGLFRDQEMLAMVGLHPRVELNPLGLEVGYWAPSRHAGKGYTTLAVKAAAIYAVDKLGCDRLQVSHDEANTASARVIEKVGFVREGVLHNHVAAPDEKLKQDGLIHSGRHPMYALWPEVFALLPWVKELRPRMEYRNLVDCPVP